MNEPLRFGTDGWRAVVARDYTFANLTRMARATAEWLSSSSASPTVVVGHDARYMGDQFAAHVADELANEGVNVLLASGITPTPAISWATVAKGASAGIVITASHNPPEYNGYKLKASFGGPATTSMTEAVEAALRPLDPGHRARGGGRITESDICTQYCDYLTQRFSLGDLGLSLVHDAMYGAAMGFYTQLLGARNVLELRSEVNPGFGGMPPEPIERHLAGLLEAVPKEAAAIGIAHDGDGDRIGVVDERGQWVTSHLVMALLVRHLHKHCGLQGTVVRTFATSSILEKMGRAWGLPVETMPIGFKYVAPRFLETDVLVGGEESGGIAVAGHIAERDGIYVGLTLLELLRARKKSVSELIQELFDEFGPHEYTRADVRTPAQPAIVAELRRAGGLREIAGRRVTGMDLLDGFKHLMDDAWLLVRPSGTEPLLRIYAEAPTMSEAEALVQDTQAQLGIDS